MFQIVALDETDKVAVVYVNNQEPDISDIRCKNTCEDHIIATLPCNDRYTYTCQINDFLKGFNLTIDNIIF